MPRIIDNIATDLLPALRDILNYDIKCPLGRNTVTEEEQRRIL